MAPPLKTLLLTLALSSLTPLALSNPDDSMSQLNDGQIVAPTAAAPMPAPSIPSSSAKESATMPTSPIAAASPEESAAAPGEMTAPAAMNSSSPPPAKEAPAEDEEGMLPSNSTANGSAPMVLPAKVPLPMNANLTAGGMGGGAGASGSAGGSGMGNGSPTETAKGKVVTSTARPETMKNDAGGKTRGGRELVCVVGAVGLGVVLGVVL